MLCELWNNVYHQVAKSNCFFFENLYYVWHEICEVCDIARHDVVLLSHCEL